MTEPKENGSSEPTYTAAFVPSGTVPDITPEQSAAISKLARRLALSFEPECGKWRALVSAGGRKVNLGLFADPREAISERRRYERRLRDR